MHFQEHSDDEELPEITFGIRRSDDGGTGVIQGSAGGVPGTVETQATNGGTDGDVNAEDTVEIGETNGGEQPVTVDSIEDTNTPSKKLERQSKYEKFIP